ncbi:MAG: galactokinase [Oscillospiraceae bacterium]
MANASSLYQGFLAKKYDDILVSFYGSDNVQLEYQRQRYADALANFTGLFGAEREVRIYSAPGRTEICGNHTDHNHGVVLAAAVNADVIAVISARDDMRIRVQSMGFMYMDDIKLDVLTPQKNETGKSSSLIRGVASAFVERGGKAGGFDAFTASNVPAGSGLSSSAAFEVCLAGIINHEYNDGAFSAIELALIGQRAENWHFGKPSGLMDQTACAVGGAMTIDFKDPSAPIVKALDFSEEKHGYAMAITSTGGSHAGLTAEYAQIRTDMQNIAAVFGQDVLRDMPFEDVLQKIPDLRERFGDRAVLRAIHFYKECQRVEAMADAIKKDNFEAFLRLITEAGHSSFEYNQNAYVASDINHQGMPVALALSQNLLQDKGAWRLQGGGFAGTIQAFVPQNIVEEYKEMMESVFGMGACIILHIRPQGFAQLPLG